MIAEIPTRTVGDQGEDAAVEFLLHHGYSIITRNYYQRVGEIDIIARQGDELVFVEVKRSRYEGTSHPELRVNTEKQKRMARCANLYLLENHPDFESCRFDIITVTRERGREVVQHYPNAFWPPDGWDEEG